MKKANRSRRNGGYTLIELMMVVAIVAIMASMAMPRFDLITQKANQAATKSNLGAIRSAIALYYSEMEGHWPLNGTPDGAADFYGTSLTEVLVPRYIEKIPIPKLSERVAGFNELGLNYDSEARSNLSLSPPRDVFILRGPQGYTPFVNRPWIYSPSDGVIYICNGNYDTAGDYFFNW